MANEENVNGMDQTYILTYKGNKDEFCRVFGLALYDSGFIPETYIERGNRTLIIGKCCTARDILEKQIDDVPSSNKPAIEADHDIHALEDALR